MLHSATHALIVRGEAGLPRASRKKRARRAPSGSEWSGPWVFVLAASGAAIGLKNVWQFPFLVSEYGGSAFLVVYVLCLLLFALPLLIAELMLGRVGRQSPVNSFDALAVRTGRSRRWRHLGWIGMCAGFLVLSYLSVVGGWLLAYVVRMATGTLEGMTADGLRNIFVALVSDPEKQLLWHSLFMLATTMVVARGVRLGLEPVAKYAVPTLLVILICALIYAAGVGDLSGAAAALLYPDFTRLTRFGILTALAHAFFSLGLGTGAMLIYAAYLKRSVGVARLALAIGGIDIAAGIVAGMAVLALLLGSGLAPVSHSELLFQALPLAFDRLPVGRAMGVVFFAGLLLAAWLSAIALAEPWVAWLSETWERSRLSAAVSCGIVAWMLGIVTVLSFNYWNFSFRFADTLKTLGAFDLLQVLSSGLLLPASGVAIALFTGWLLKSEMLRDAFDTPSPCPFEVWLGLVRVVAPALILLVVLQADRLFL